MSSSELSSAYSTAMSDAGVLAYKQYLESQGYTHIPANSIGIVRDSDGAYLVNLGFNKGDESLTSHIIFAQDGSGSVTKRQFVEGTIDPVTGELYITVGKVIDGSGNAQDDPPTAASWGGFAKCVLAACGAAAAGCLLSNCGYLHCLALWCGGGIAGCGLGELLDLILS